MRSWTAASTSRCWSIVPKPPELRRGDGGSEVIARPGLVHNLDLGARERPLDQPADLVQIDHRRRF